jgi:two-component sensor histidine kinase
VKRPAIVESVLRIVLPYLLLGAAWILFSDRLLLVLTDDPKAMVVLSTAKGWLYVLVTGILLYSLVYGELRRRTVLEARLREGLAEKVALLAELNHRVKNNLQIISSILNLETENLLGEEARALNDRTRARLQSMNIAYERLFENARIARIDLGGYLRALWEIMKDIYRAKDSIARFELQDIEVGAEEAVPFGLFATEAMTNAILYGADSGGKSFVTISLSLPLPGTVELTVRDTGPGLSVGAAGLGLKLMDALGAQLRGRVERGNEGGAVVRLRFATTGVDDGRP